MDKDNHIIIEIPEAQLDFSNDNWKEQVKNDFIEIRNSLESNPNSDSPAYYTWFWFFMKYGHALCSPEGQAYLKANSLNAFNLVKDVVGLTMSGGGAYTIGYKFFDECLKNTPDINVSGIKIQRKESINKSSSNLPLQQIFYGAPGTGKSHKTDEVASKYTETVRTTFHPDSDYSTFVGAYKPTMEEVEVKTVPVVVAGGITLEQNKGTYKEKKIAYRFVKQAFLKAYVKAWKLFKETCVEGGELAPQFLVIEEINRGNCAQIFGDLFQLLDRKNNFSEYPVEADADICKALLEEDTDDNPSFGTDGLQLTDEQKAYVNNVYGGNPVADKICKGEVLVLPPNLYIWATMNTSDQSLFPIDSAFKRRWDWKYMKIRQGYKKDEQGDLILDAEGKKIPLGWKIEIKGEKDEENFSQDWWEFIRKINDIIASMTSSADKQLGYFFCKADNAGVISGETFVSKVVFYLWNDVFKDYGFEDASLFRYKAKVEEKEVEKDLTVPDFYDEEGENVNVVRLVDFIRKVMAWQKPEENA